MLGQLDAGNVSAAYASAASAAELKASVSRSILGLILNYQLAHLVYVNIQPDSNDF